MRQWINPRTRHWCQVDHHSIVTKRVTSHGVAPATHGYKSVLLPGEADNRHDVCDAAAAGDEMRPAIDVSIPYSAEVVVGRVPRLNQFADEGRSKIL
jgi:hypothetical protein